MLVLIIIAEGLNLATESKPGATLYVAMCVSAVAEPECNLILPKIIVWVCNLQ